MARKGKISMVKVNNWFINARERTVKGYFMKDGWYFVDFFMVDLWEGLFGNSVKN